MVVFVVSPGYLVYLTGISFAMLSPEDRKELLSLISSLHDQGVQISYDTNFRPRLWPVDEARALHQRLHECVDIFLTSHAEEAALWGDADIDATADRLARLDIPEFVVRGEPGRVITRDGASVTEPVAPGRVVDTTAAGDSFNGAYFAARLSGLGVAQAVAAGHALSAVVVQHPGAIIPREATPPLDALLGA